MLDSSCTQKVHGMSLIKHPTKADGDCFFHAVFGDQMNGVYQVKNAPEMRQEWYKFLSKFDFLNDQKMSVNLKEHLEKVFNFFLDNPEDLTGRSTEIKHLAEETKKKIEASVEEAKQLKRSIAEKLSINEDEIGENLQRYALENDPNLTADDFMRKYNSEFIANAFLGSVDLYKYYLETITDQNFVFFKEIPVLASLANIKIICIYDNGNRREEIEPNIDLLGSHQSDRSIWGNKTEALIYYESAHFSHAAFGHHNHSSDSVHQKRTRTCSDESIHSGSSLKKPRVSSSNNNVARQSSVAQHSNSDDQPVSKRGDISDCDQALFVHQKKSRTEPSSDHQDIVEVGQTNSDVTKRKQAKQSWSFNDQHAASASKYFLHGNDYQLKLLMFFAWKCRKHEVAFRLATEMDEAGKFDDLVLRYKEDSDIKYRFLQAKHMQFLDEKNKISVNDLKTNNKKSPFSLNKYFSSYEKLKLNDEFKDGSIEDLIICTNTGFGFTIDANQKGWGSYFEEIKAEDEVLGSLGKRYKFRTEKKKEISKLLRTTRNQRSKADKREFLDKVVFAVDQPSGPDLGEIIGKNIGAEFNLINDSIYNDFYRFMSEWMQHRLKGLGKEGKGRACFLTHEDLNVFFSEAKKKIATLVSIGLTSLYRIKIKKFGLVFNDNTIKELKNFLQQNEYKVLNLFTSETILGAIKVHQALNNVELYNKEDSHIFISLKKLLILERLTEAFESETSLLIIECKSTERDVDNLYSKLETIMQRDGKKIIVIANENDPLAGKFKTNSRNDKYREIKDTNISFNDITPGSQTKLLDYKVIFQGKEVSLRDISKESERLIDAVVLSKLIRNEKIEIGKAPMDSKFVDVQDYYIDRTFSRQIIDEENLKKKTSKFLVTYDRHFIESDFQKDQDLVLISNVDGDFQELCDKYKDRNVHLLIKENNELIWQKSHGDLSNLRAFVNAELKPGVLYGSKFSDIENICDEIVVISAEPGMGKSTVLTKQAEKFKELDPSLWVVKINLSDHTQKFSKPDFRIDKDGAINFLLDVTVTGPETTLEKNLFEFMIKEEGKIVLLFDGFDEISPNYKEIVIGLLRIFKFMKFKTLWVTTRPNMRNILEDEFGTFSYTLKPLSEKEQKIFLQRFWNKKNKFNIENSERLNNYIEKLLQLLKNSISDKETEFTGIPLQTRMLAEAFQNEFEEFFESNKLNLPKKLNLVNLYELFVERKYKDWYLVEKKGIDTTKPGNEYDKLLKVFLKEQKLLALSGLFSGEDLSKFLSPEETVEIADCKKDLKSGKENTGIIIHIIGDKPSFVHRTFAEYFAAFWFADKKYYKQEVKVFLLENLFKVENGVLRNFFDRILAKDMEGESKYELHNAVLNDDEYKINKLLGDQEKAKHIINTIDKGGRTALHLAVAYSTDNFHDSILSKVLLDHRADVGIADNVFEWTPLEYADRGHSWLIAEMLLERGADGNMNEAIKNVGTFYRNETLLHMAARMGYAKFAKVLVDNGVDLNALDRDHKTPLHLAIENGDFRKKDKLELVKYLIPKANVNLTDKAGRTPLHLAIENYYMRNNGELEVVKCLITKENINLPDKAGSTPLHLAAKCELDIVKCLFEQLCCRCLFVPSKMADEKGRTPVHVAAEEGKLNIVEYFHEKNFLMNEADSDGLTPLHLAAKNDFMDIVAYLIKNKSPFKLADKKGKTPLHLAAKTSCVELVKLLTKHVAEEMNDGYSEVRNFVNTKDNKGRTPLYLSIYVGKIGGEGKGNRILKIIKNLIDKGADVGLADEEGMTPLHLAATLYEPKIMKYLMKRTNAIVLSDLMNAGTEDGRTPLHLAAKKSLYLNVKYLIGQGAVNLSDEKGRSALHWACMGDGRDDKTLLAVVKYLVHKGADVNLKDKKGRTPLFFAVGKYYGFKVAKYLVDEHKVQLNVVDEKGRTLVHQAAQSGNVTIMKYLVKEKNFGVHVEDVNGVTPLHFAAKIGMLELVKYLADRTNISLADNDGRTPLFWATESGSLEIVKYLVDDKGASVNLEDKKGLTPLHWAVLSTYGCGNVVRFLLTKVEENHQELGTFLFGTKGSAITPIHYVTIKRYDSYVTDILLNKMKENQDGLKDLIGSEKNEVDFDDHHSVIKLLFETAAEKFIKNKRSSILHEAVRIGTSKVLKIILDKIKEKDQQDFEKCINDINEDGYTPLTWAVGKRNVDAVKILLEYKADVNFKDKNGNTPLLLAAMNGYLSLVKYLLIDKDANVDVTGEDGVTSFLLAAKKGNIEVIKCLVEKGVDVNLEDKDGNTPLLLAAQNGNVNVVEHLLIAGNANVDVKGEDGITSFLLAVKKDNIELMKFLAEKGVDVNSKDGDGKTPLHLATLADKLDVIKYLVDEKKALIDIQDKEDWTPLHLAVRDGKVDIVKYLVDRGAKVNAVESDGLTPIHFAAYNGLLDILKHLIEYVKKNQPGTLNEFVNATDINKKTPLHLAAQKGNLNVVECLVEEGADVKLIDKDGMTPLHLATLSNKLDVLKYLVDQKEAYIDVQNEEGWTPLHLAVRNGKVDIVKYLVDRGAKVNAVTSDGWTPILLAAYKGFWNIVKHLIEYVKKNQPGTLNEFVNATDINKNTPLHLAAQEGNFNVVEYLVEEGADVKLIDKDGMTPLHLATLSNKLDVLKYLVDQKEAYIDVQNEEGWTPLHLAVRNGKVDIVKYLVDRGAKVNAVTSDGWTPIHLAAYYGHFIVKHLIDFVEKNHLSAMNDFVNATDINGNTPLHLALQKGNLDVVEYLLIDKGASLDVNGEDGIALFLMAAKEGNIVVLKYLVREGADVNSTDKSGKAPLHLATLGNKLNVLKYLVDEREAYIDVQDGEGWTPLHLAVRDGKVDIVKYLVDRGAKVNAVGKNGWTHLHLAAYNGLLDILKHLIEYVKKNQPGTLNEFVNATDINKNTPLHLAAQEGNLNVVEYLVKEGADVILTDKYGKATLHLATLSNKLDVLKYLVDQKKAYIDIQDGEGWTPLHYAARNNKVDLVKYLVQKGAKVNAVKNDGWTPIHLAAYNGHLDIVKHLIDFVQKNHPTTFTDLINVRDNNNMTPLHLAAINGHVDVVRYLIRYVEEKRPCDLNDFINAKDNIYGTPLIWAVTEKNWEVANVLVDHKADIDDLNENQKQELSNYNPERMSINLLSPSESCSPSSDESESCSSSSDESESCCSSSDESESCSSSSDEYSSMSTSSWDDVDDL